MLGFVHRVFGGVLCRAAPYDVTNVTCLGRDTKVRFKLVCLGAVVSSERRF